MTVSYFKIGKKNIATVSHALIALAKVSQIGLKANWDRPLRLYVLLI